MNKIDLLDADRRIYVAKLAALTDALQKAAELIAIPAHHHDLETKADAFAMTGLPRYSAGARKHNRACAALLPILRAALDAGRQ